MNKRGLVGFIIVLVVAVILVIAAIIYFTGSFGFSTGKVSIDINYNDSVEHTDEKIVEIPAEEIVNDNNYSNLTIGENKSLNYSNLTG